MVQNLPFVRCQQTALLPSALKGTVRVIIKIMSTRTTLTLAVAAGFFGGIISQRIVPTPVFAQAQPLPPTEIQAQRFVLVDKNGTARGVFGFETNGSPVIEITGDKGHVFTTRWYGAGPGVVDFHEPPSLPHKATLLP
jgi:hypothetical protein